MFKIFKSAKLYQLTLSGLLLLVLIPAMFIETKSGSTAVIDSGRAVSKLHEMIEKADGKPSEEQLADFERSYPKTKAASLARFLRAYQRYTTMDYAGSAPLFEESVIKEETQIGDYALYYQ